jgi:hypothetical protein
MTLQDLIRRFRTLAFDREIPPFWPDADVRDWLNDAQAQAAVRGRLLLEDAKPEICEIAIQAGQHTYPLHAALYELVHLQVEGAQFETRTPKLVTREWLDRKSPGWRAGEHLQAGEILFAIQGETTIRLVSTPVRAGVLRIEGYRLPLVPMVENTDAPEIHPAHHEHLVQWALHRGFSIPDTETFDPTRSAAAEAEFTAYFGPLPDSDLRRSTRDDTDHVTVVHP